MARTKPAERIAPVPEKAATKGRAARNTLTSEQITKSSFARTRAEGKGAKIPSKRSLLIERLSRPEGAGIDELTKALGWLPHTVRAALTGLRRKGYAINRTKPAEGGSVYRAAPPSAEKKPGRPSAKHAA